MKHRPDLSQIIYQTVRLGKIMHLHELTIHLDQKTYIYQYESPIPLGKGVVIENIGGANNNNPVFIVESITIDLTGSVEVTVCFSQLFDKEKLKKWHSFVQNNWKCL